MPVQDPNDKPIERGSQLQAVGTNRRPPESTMRKRRVSRVLQDGARFGKYQIVRLIAKGGMSEIYEAIHAGLKKPVALKVLRLEMAENPEARERFVAEGEKAARVRHANVVDVSDVGIIDELPYLIMELLDGEDLGALYERNGRMPACDVVDLLLPIASAVGVAHEQGVIHRDLKPDNIFLQYDGRRVVPKLLDFGASRALYDARITVDASVLGTPHYMSPEQARGDRTTDARTDQYALGVMIYEGVTGCLPRDGENPLELLHSVAYGSFEPPSHHAKLPEGLEAVILRAMASEPSQRFASMCDLALALVPFASDAAREYWSIELTFPSGGRSADIKQPALTSRVLTPARALPSMQTGGQPETPSPDNLPPLAPHTSPSPTALPAVSMDHELAETFMPSRRRRALWGALVAAGLCAAGVGFWLGSEDPTDTGAAIAPVDAPNGAAQSVEAHQAAPVTRANLSASAVAVADPDPPASTPTTLVPSSSPTIARPKSVRAPRRYRPVAAKSVSQTAPVRPAEQVAPAPQVSVVQEAPPKIRVIDETDPAVKIID